MAQDKLFFNGGKTLLFSPRVSDTDDITHGYVIYFKRFPSATDLRSELKQGGVFTFDEML